MRPPANLDFSRGPRAAGTPFRGVHLTAHSGSETRALPDAEVEILKAGWGSAENAPRGVAAGDHARRWPSYPIALARAKLKPDGTPDRSDADFSWSMICITGGKGIEETIAKLLELGARANAPPCLTPDTRASRLRKPRAL